MDSILDAIGNTPLVRLRRCAPRERRRALAEARVPQPDRVDEGPDGARDDRGRRARRAALARRHGRRVHGRQHRPCARARLPREGLPRADRDGRLLHRRALPAAARPRRGDRRRPLRRGPAEGHSAGHPRTWSTRAAELAAQPGHYATDQFNNPYIIPDHRDRLGREIWEQTERPRHRVLSGHGHRELADGRVAMR